MGKKRLNHKYIEKGVGTGNYKRRKKQQRHKKVIFNENHSRGNTNELLTNASIEFLKEKGYDVKERICLACNDSFLSAGKHNRICLDCKIEREVLQDLYIPKVFRCKKNDF